MDEIPSKFQHNDLYKKALGNLLKRRDYHNASPEKKRKMLLEECSGIPKKRRIIKGYEN